MANASVGGLYVTVSLDTRNAVRDLRRLKKEFEKTFSSTASLGGGSAGGDGGNKTLSDTAKNAVVATAAVKGLSGATRGLTSDFAQFGLIASRGNLGGLAGAASGLTSKFAAMAPVIAAVGASLVGIAVAGGIAIVTFVKLGKAVFEFGKIGFQAAQDLELLGVSMTAILGSGEAAASEIAAVQEIARTSPFLTDTVIEMDKFLISQGLASAEIRGNLVPAVLDMSAAFGLTTDNVKSISFALSQVQSRGYLSGDEGRQLANQLVPVWNILREIPALADKSQQELRKLAEQGAISAEALFLAYTKFAEQYGDAAAKAALTTRGLTENLKDIAQQRLGQAFIDVDTSEIEGLASPLGVIRDALLEITILAKDLDFAPLAASMGAVVNSVIGPLTEWIQGNGETVRRFFEEQLPSALLVTAQVFTYLGAIARIFVEAFVVIAQGVADAWGGATRTVGRSVGSWGNIWKVIAAVVATAAGAIITFVNGTLAAIRTLMAVLTLNFGAALNGAKDQLNSFGQGMSFAENAYASMAKTIDDIGDMSLPDLGSLGDGIAEFNDAATEFGVGTGAGEDGAGGAAKATADEMAKAMNILYELSQSWLGMRSDLEQGLLGKDGFTATIDQIANMGKKLVDALVILGADDAVASVTASTIELIELAKRRTEVAEDLADAERALADLVTQRNRFTAQIRKSAIDFASALKLETETTKTFELQSDRGFFFETETRQTKDYVESLRERSKALKQFFADIKLLSDRGINEQFLEQLLLAGPDQSGEVARALADGGQEMINEVNVLYGDITKTADALAEFGAEEFYDAGVVQAEALVEGLQSDLDAITAAAEEIGQSVFDIIEPWAKEMEDLGRAGAGGLAKGMGGGINAITASARDIVFGTTEEFSELSDKMTQAGRDGSDGFTEGFFGGFEGFEGELGKITGQIEKFLADVKAMFSGRAIVDFTFELSTNAVKSFYRMFVKMLSALGWVTLGLLGLDDVFRTLQRLSGSSGGVSGGSGGGGGGGGASFSSSSGYLSSTFAAQQLLADTRVAGFSDDVNSLQGFGSTQQGTEPVTVKVYIGDQELRSLVKTEIVYSEDGQVSRVIAGRRV